MMLLRYDENEIMVNFNLSLVIKVKDDVFLSMTKDHTGILGLKEKSECSQQESNRSRTYRVCMGDSW